MSTAALHDPVRFVHEADGDLQSSFDELCRYEAAPAMATYKQARAALIRFLGGVPPFSIGDGSGAQHPFHQMDEAAMDLWCDAYRDGLAAGAAYEQLRRRLVARSKLCPACDGVGSVSTDGRRAMQGGDRKCDKCRGAGVISPHIER